MKNTELREARLTKIEAVNFTARTYNCLNRANVRTLGEIALMTEKELFKIRNLGKIGVNEIINKLAGYGLTLREEDLSMTQEEIDECYEEYCRNEEAGLYDYSNADDACEGRGMAFQMMMRDTHGTIETENWGVVGNAGTFDENGNPVEYGMYDPEIFGKASDKEPYLTQDIEDEAAIMELALPVNDPYCPSEISPDQWIHLTAIPILPPSLRPMSTDGKEVSEEAKRWNALAELNFSIPKLLEENPERESELQGRLQEAVNHVYALYVREMEEDEEYSMYTFLYDAMNPVEIQEDYDTVVNLIKTLKEAGALCEKEEDAQRYAEWVCHLTYVCYILSYDSEEVKAYRAWAMEVLQVTDAMLDEPAEAESIEDHAEGEDNVDGEDDEDEPSKSWCVSCGSILETKREQHDGGDIVYLRCEHCRKTWKLQLDEKNILVKTTVEYDD